MTESIRIVPMQKEHLPVLAAIERQCFSQPWSEEALAAELIKPSAIFLVAVAWSENVRTGTENFRIVGYGGMDVIPPEAYIANVAVDPTCRRQAVATRLVAALLQKARAKGCTVVSLEVRVSNAPAIGLYEKHGFQKVGIRPGFYARPTEDALIMTWQRA